MTNRYVDPPGEGVGVSQLSVPKACDLAGRLSRDAIAFASLVDCRVADASDVIVLDVETETPQVREYDIRPVERLAVCFDHEDSASPQVLALREDFPATPHQYPPTDSVPKRLCLFEEEYPDLQRRWTAAFFVRRIRDWLRLTARGEMHAQDQPLEQVFAVTGHRIILPHALSKLADVGATNEAVPVAVTGVDEYRGRLTILTAIAERAKTGAPPPYLALSFTSAPHPPDAIATPHTISELHDFLAAHGDDLIAVLRRRLLEWSQQPNVFSSQLILIVRVPKRRDAAGAPETSETVAFLGPPVRDIGTALGVWEITPRGLALMVPVPQERRGENAMLEGLSVHFRISRADAAQLNGRDSADDRRIIGIGAGALGSQVIMNCARAAFGRWTIIDRDRLLPHNVTRHALGEFGVGYHKAVVLASVANLLTDDLDAFDFVVADVLAPGPDRQLVEERLDKADLIVDLAASIAVGRYLALDAPGSSRRVSFFLNPAGSDLVMLSEDRDRQVRLHMLEMQYYRAGWRDERLRGHLRRPEGGVRYGRSCRDVSLRLPQEFVGLHAAIAARELRGAADRDGAALRVWRIENDSSQVSVVDVDASAPLRETLGDWTVLYDAELLKTIRGLRAQRLPNETGGILLGAFDVERKTIYVIDTIPSPVDSEERQTLYIRGCEGLREQLEVARRETFDQLEYVGEWHSHPDGASCLPSGADLTVLDWLTGHMETDGLPGILMIACERDQLAVMVASVTVRHAHPLE